MAQLALQGQLTGQRRLRRLPSEATSFVGRKAELSKIAALLGSARLITVVGPGGVGKTRICLRAAMLCADRFPDGVCLVELSGLRDPVLLINAVAAGLGLPERDAATQHAAVLDHLRDRRLLLILDTCEHLLDACAALAETVLRTAAGVTVLATSRQPFDAPGEHALPVPPLTIGVDAVELFAQRAAAVFPDFAVTPANRADVIRLCRRLDGIPLAIELAAVRMRALPLTELVNLLETGFSVLAVSRRGVLPRHQMLRNAIEWSHQLCAPTEQVLWGRLSVFHGTFEVAAVEEVCSDDVLPRDEVVHALIGLVDKSVVQRTGETGAGGKTGGKGGRYRLLDTVREFGAERLAADGSQGLFMDRLTDRYLAMATHFDEHFLDDDQPERYHELRGEHVSIRAALDYTLGDADDHGRHGGYDDYGGQRGGRTTPASPEVVERWRRGCLLAVRLSPYWQLSGLLNEGRHWLDKALRAFTAPSPERAWALGIRGRLATFHGDLGNAVADIRESIKVAEEIGERLAAARGYFYLNLALTFAGQHAEALAAGRTARERMTACDDHIGLACLWPQLAHLHQLAGDVNAAIECCERGLEKLDEFGEPGLERGERWITSYLYLISGFALFQLPGRDDDCADATRRALRAKHDLGDEVGIAFSLEVLGWLAARGSRFEQAAWLLGAADPIWQRTGSRLSNIAIMEQTHQRVVESAREALGGPRYEFVHAQGTGPPLNDVVAHATGGGNALPWRGAGGSRTGGRPRPDGRYGGAAATAAVTPITTADLTKREREIAMLVASGLSNREIATRLYISKRTVDAHVEHIFAKLDISSRVKLTMWLQSQMRVGALSDGA